jgi:hypothetical protein
MMDDEEDCEDKTSDANHCRQRDQAANSPLASFQLAAPLSSIRSTESGTATAGILLTLQFPAIVTSMLIGWLIDRFQPGAIIAIDNGLRTLIIGLIPILYWFNILELWLLFLLTFMAGLLAPATEVGARTIQQKFLSQNDWVGVNFGI